MTEKPIIMSGESVRAILDGRKTQTRRALKHQPNAAWAKPPIYVQDGRWACRGAVSDLKCPYGKPGDRLWVRERLRRKTNCTMGEWPSVVCYDADEHIPGKGSGEHGFLEWPWKRDTLPAIFMPKWAARIWLEVTDVRAERLQDISQADMDAEGLGEQGIFCACWNVLNARRGYGWDTNPYVWVVEFRRGDA